MRTRRDIKAKIGVKQTRKVMIRYGTCLFGFMSMITSPTARNAHAFATNAFAKQSTQRIQAITPACLCGSVSLGLIV